MFHCANLTCSKYKIMFLPAVLPIKSCFVSNINNPFLFLFLFQVPFVYLSCPELSLHHFLCFSNDALSVAFSNLWLHIHSKLFWWKY